VLKTGHQDFMASSLVLEPPGASPMRLFFLSAPGESTPEGQTLS
jgi:hypothetical protein